MNKKNLLIIILISIVLSLIVFKLKNNTKEYIFKGSSLPGQVGTKTVDSKYISNSTKKGFLTYGPYVKLQSGTYLFDISYSSSKANGAKFDIVTKAGSDIRKKGNLKENSSFGHIKKNIEINSNQALQNWEVRVWYDGKGELSLHSIKITKQFGYIESKKILKYFVVLLLLNILIFYAFKFSKNITIFTLLLIAIVSLSFVADAYINYYKYKEMTYKDMPLTKDIFKYFFNQSIKSENIKLTAPELKRDNNIESFYLMVDKKDLELLNSDLPLSGIENYVDARLKVNDGKSSKVKIRYRGGSAWNWRYDRKSIKIKFKSDNSYNMMKTINFSVLYSQDMFIEPITQKVAKKMGALAPEVKTVRMFINGEYVGLYLYLDQVDESFLRKNKLMPGSIYDGDYSLKEKWSSYIGKDGIAKLWFDSKIWDKKAARNAEQKKITEDIELLIDAVNNYDDKAFYDFASTYLSSQYYTYLALDVLWGTHHHDYFHNHKIYFDPYKGKYTAISWDVRFWKSNKNKDNSYYPLIERIGLNPLLEFKRDKELYRLLKTVNIEYINKLMSEEKNKFMDSYLADKKRKKISIDTRLFPWKETFNPPQLTVATKDTLDNIFKTYSNNLKIRIEFLHKMLEDVSVNYKITKYKDNVKILFAVDGNSPVILKYKNIMLYPARNIVNKNALNLDTVRYGKTHLQNRSQFYTLTIKNEDFNEEIFQSGTNAITNKNVIFKKVDNIKVKATDSIHPDKLSKPNYKTKILKGTIKVTKTLQYDKYTNVIIKPNTTFIISPNQSIYFYGKVTAIGTKNKPIKFVALDDKKPWGLVAVQGKSTTGSKFYFCEFSNGSIDTKNLIHYTSQFNIHDMDDFEVKNCFIGRNFKGDDAMHIAYAKGIVDNCTFEDARSDGLDIDISNVTITNNKFLNSGNDGLDIMTTTMKANNNTFVNMGDKGISVGEWSEANITNSIFTNTVIGLEIKDKSKVIASNLKFINTKEKAINLYNKNKRYDIGGFLEATNIKFIGNSIVKADKKSRVKIDE
ncbi:MAG: CotH kinase family protein [Campylobacterota bacterium]|nr:CotH kinase family protein [Campylobacterota bacterium]